MLQRIEKGVKGSVRVHAVGQTKGDVSIFLLKLFKMVAKNKQNSEESFFYHFFICLYFTDYSLSDHVNYL